MQHSNRLIVLILLIIAGLLFAACNTHGPEKTGEKPAHRRSYRWVGIQSRESVRESSATARHPD